MFRKKRRGENRRENRGAHRAEKAKERESENCSGEGGAWTRDKRENGRE